MKIFKRIIGVLLVIHFWIALAMFAGFAYITSIIIALCILLILVFAYAFASLLTWLFE